MIRVARRAAALFLLALALTTLIGTTALAATPSPSTNVEVFDYTGTGHTTATDPKQVDPSNSYPASIHIDCTSGTCLATATVVDTGDGNRSYNLSGAVPVPLVNGHGVLAVENNGNPCDDQFLGGGTLTVDATPTQATATRTLEAVGEYQCGNTTIVYPAGYTVTLTTTIASPTGCLVNGSCPTPSPTPTPTATSTVLAAGDSAPLLLTPHAIRIADPSTLSTLPVAATGLTPANILWAAAATVVLVLLIALPSHLLNSATEAGTDRVSEWWATKRERFRVFRRAGADTPSTSVEADGEHPPAPAKPVNLAGWPLAAAGVLAASLISSFVSPSFGLNPVSGRVFLSILLSFLLDAVAGWFLLILLVRRANPGATARFRFAPASLIIVAVAVLFTRLTGFEPGIVFGLVAGVVFGAVIASAEKARLALISLGYSFVLAVIGWAGYSAISATDGAHPAAPLVFAQETLSAMAIGGIAALPIALIPLRGLAGHEIWSWNRWVWGGAYGVGLVGFFVVLMPKPFSWTTVGLSVWVWFGIFAAYAVAAVTLWLLITRPWRREEERDEETAAASPAPAEVGVEQA